MIFTVTLSSSADDDRESGHRGKEAGENDAGDESRSTQRDERTGVGKCLIYIYIYRLIGIACFN